MQDCIYKLKTQMKAAIISFDITRTEDPEVSLSIASILAYVLKSTRHSLNHYSINLENRLTAENEIDICSIEHEILYQLSTDKYSIVFISAYIWSDLLTNKILESIKGEFPNLKLVLGGYQMHNTTPKQLKEKYKLADLYIVSKYSEQDVLNVLDGNYEADIYGAIKKKDVQFSELASPYLDGIILINGKSKIRWETVRGCPHTCSFCAHKDLDKAKVHELGRNLEEEIKLFNNSNTLKKVNILDPSFSITKSNLNLLRKLLIRQDLAVSIQVRGDILHFSNPLFNELIEIGEQGNLILEIGVQTLNLTEDKHIDRNSKLQRLLVNLEELSKRGVNLETSLIYGLPDQTVSSFKENIAMLRNAGVSNIVAYPLMLLPGTSMYDKKDVLGLKEEQFGIYRIPTVVSSPTFSYEDWLEMASISNALVTNSGILGKRL